jgi:hypothetical protein
VCSLLTELEMRKVSSDSVTIVDSASGVKADRSRRRRFLRVPDAYSVLQHDHASRYNTLESFRLE